MKNRVFALAVLCGFVAVPEVASATVVAKVSLSAQRVDVSVDGSHAYSWPVSTARKGYVTPTGQYRAQRTAKMWYSRKYDMSPMPYSVFFHGGYAIHGTNYLKSLGRPASHGCIRLAPGNAAKFYSLVREYGLSNARVIITR